MRQIKFRAWDKKEKKMFWVNEIRWVHIEEDSSPMTLTFQLYSLPTPLDEKNNKGQGYLEKEFKNLELMQFTGLKDKNGREIYEGDLVKVGEQIYQIAWYALSSAFWLFTTATTGEGNYTANAGVPVRDYNFLNGGNKVNWHKGLVEELEVIGNIYENKDLLK